MAKFKAIPIAELAQIIPGWTQMALKSQLDMDNFANMLEAIENYGEQNGMQFFQIHHRKIDNSAVAVFKLKA
ncbi:MAG TPA: hypothetical protein VK177_07860 [Flavobacteriales bacterium]|nr:hypothetical protein [Flavobacteriales bacterium]